MRSIQNSDGGWGESCASYDNGSFMAAPSTPSQTAWAMLALAGRRRHHQHQPCATASNICSERRKPTEAGMRNWPPAPGFPKVFYLNYHLYRNSFPLLALNTFLKSEIGSDGQNEMRFPLSMTAGMAGYIFKNKFRPRPEWQKTVARPRRTRPIRSASSTRTPTRRGKPHPMINKRFPLVLMLEPLHACNLTCTGCGRIREYESTITRARAAGRVPGRGGRVRRAHGFHLRRRADDVSADRPNWPPEFWSATRPYLSVHQRHVHREAPEGIQAATSASIFNVHLDGMEKNHDIAVEREGVFREAIEGIKAAKAAGFQVCTNTTVYKETDMNEIEELFEYLEQFNVDGHHDFAGLRLFGRERSRDLHDARRYPREVQGHRQAGAAATRCSARRPIYMEFLKGERDFPAPPGAIRLTTSKAGKARAT